MILHFLYSIFNFNLVSSFNKNKYFLFFFVLQTMANILYIELLTNITLIVFMLMSIISISIGIWTLINLHQFNKFSTTFVFKQRYPILVRGICYLIVFNMFIRTPLLYFMITHDVYHSYNAYVIMVIIEGFFYSFTTHGMIWLNLIRFVIL